MSLYSVQDSVKVIFIQITVTLNFEKLTKMADNNSNEFPKRKPSSNSNGGLQGWIVAAIIMGIIGFLLFSRQATLAPIKYKQLEQMILQKDVEKVAVVEGNRSVEVTLTRDALQKPEYKKA